MSSYSETELDLLFIRLLRKFLGKPWDQAKSAILESLPEGVDPKLIAKYVDDSEHPSINENAYGVEPRFYAHRTSRRLLEFYPSKEWMSGWKNEWMKEWWNEWMKEWVNDGISLTLSNKLLHKILFESTPNGNHLLARKVNLVAHNFFHFSGIDHVRFMDSGKLLVVQNA